MAALLLLVRLVQFARYSLDILSFPFELDPTESIVLSESVLLKQGVNIFGPITPDRFISAAYGPVYYVLTAALLPLTGPSYLGGRLLSLAATLLIAGALGYVVTTAAGRARFGLLAAGLWLGSVPAAVWATRLKPDLVAIALSAGVVAIVAAGYGDRPARLLRRGWLSRLPPYVPAAVLGALAFHTKQSAVAGPIAVFLYLLWRDRAVAVRFAALLAGLVIGPTVILDLATHHGFWVHTVDFHRLPWSAARYLRLLGDMASAHPVIFALAGLYLARSGWRRAPSLLALYLLAAALGSLSGGTFGGYPNHLLELLAAGAAAASSLVAVPPRVRWPAPPAALLGLAIAAQVGFMFVVPSWLSYEYAYRRSVPEDRLAKLEAFVAGAPGEVFSGNVGLLVLAGRPVRFNDPLVMAKAAELGWWDESQFVAAIRAGEFRYILWRQDLTRQDQPGNDLSPAAFAAIRERYRVLYRDVLTVYEPK